MNSARRTQALTLLAGVGAGIVLAYFLDPGRGARRRHVVADRTTSTARRLRRRANEAAVDARNRARGVAAEVRARRREESVSDDQLVARVRAELGHHVEHARAIEVSAEDGTVTLRGTVLAAEVPGVVGAVARVRGVARVENQLDVRDAAGNTPSLQR